MSNFISQSLTAKLGVPQCSIYFSVVGIGQAQTNIWSSCTISVSSRCFNFHAELHCYVIPEIANNVPGAWFDPMDDGSNHAFQVINI